MSDPVSRARSHFAQIQITMISIIVALALQQWLDLLPTVDALWEPNVLAARIWCEALIAFVIIIKMWSGFVLAAVVNERVPTATDLLGPIGILIFVDAQIASIGVEHAVRFWYVLGAGSLLAAVFIHAQSLIDLDRRAAVGPELAAARSNVLRRMGAAVPSTAEVFLGSAALVVAVLHQTIQMPDSGLLFTGIVYLAAQLLSAAGPILAWRALRRIERRDA